MVCRVPCRRCRVATGAQIIGRSSAHDSGHEAALVVDGKTGVRDPAWSSQQGATMRQWITFDLFKPTAIGTVEFHAVPHSREPLLSTNRPPERARA